jgi:hypothetical protein
MKDGDQVERDGRKYRVGWFLMFETASGSDAIDDIMDNWRRRKLLAYVQLAKKLRRCS